MKKIILSALLFFTLTTYAADSGQYKPAVFSEIRLNVSTYPDEVITFFKTLQQLASGDFLAAADINAYDLLSMSGNFNTLVQHVKSEVGQKLNPDLYVGGGATIIIIPTKDTNARFFSINDMKALNNFFSGAQHTAFNMFYNNEKPFHFVGAIINVDLSPEGGKVTAQLALNLHPQTLPMPVDGGPIQIENLVIPKSTEYNYASYAFIEISQEIKAGAQAQMKIDFGPRGEIIQKADRSYAFAPSVNLSGWCMRSKSTPYLQAVEKKTNFIPVSLYLNSLELNLDSQKLTEAKLKVALSKDHMSPCLGSGFVNKMFVESGNAFSENVIKDIKAKLGQILQKDNEALLEEIESQR